MTKEKFCEELCKLLQETDQHRDLERLEYRRDANGEEWAVPFWQSPNTDHQYEGRPINVTADSETAIIKDVLRGLE